MLFEKRVTCFRLHSFGPLWTISTGYQWEINEAGRLNCFSDFLFDFTLFVIDVEEILHKQIFSWDVRLESRFMSHKRIFSWDVRLESKFMSHKRIFSWDVHLESKFMSHKRICLCEQSVYAESPLQDFIILNIAHTTIITIITILRKEAVQSQPWLG